MDKNDRMNRLLDFIEKTNCNDLDKKIIEQGKKCFLDLAGVLCAGAKNNTAKVAAEYVNCNYPHGEVTVLRNGEKTNLLGAALANGMAANALDMDDGYSLLRGHPGAGFIGALLSAGEFSNCTYGEFLAALVVSYELSIREGYSIRDYYGWDHSSGSYSAFGTAAGVSKLLKLDREKVEMALGISDFIMPVNPAKRSCYIPSMNKDGIYWGQHAGMQAVLLSQSGFSGRNPVIIDEKYEKYIESLGEKWYLFDLYIKFYSCCRWVHSPIQALSDMMTEYSFSNEDVKHIDVFSFGNAGTLYKDAPTCEDEAQYNIRYPLAAQLLWGNCGPLESSTTRMLDYRVESTIEKIAFHQHPEYDKVFPGKRLSHIEVELYNGKRYKSATYEPRGDRNSDISIEEIIEKNNRINGLYADNDLIQAMIDAVLLTPLEDSFKGVFEPIKILAMTNIHPEYEFI